MQLYVYAYARNRLNGEDEKEGNRVKPNLFRSVLPPSLSIRMSLVASGEDLRAKSEHTTPTKTNSTRLARSELESKVDLIWLSLHAWSSLIRPPNLNEVTRPIRLLWESQITNEARWGKEPGYEFINPPQLQ